MTAESEAARRDLYIQHLVRMVELGHREYAWSAAKAYGVMDPYCLAGLREALAAAMKAKAEAVAA